jgi:hypothetical protein
MGVSLAHKVVTPSIIVWDLETPDLAGFAVANDLVGKSDVEIREARKISGIRRT